MAYSKLFKACQDFVLGYQQVNAAVANEAAIRAGYTAKHRQSDVSFPGAPSLVRVGQHNDQLVPRGVLVVSVTTTTVGTSSVVHLDATINSPSIVGVERYGAGLYFVATQGLAGYPFATATPLTTGVSTKRLITTRWRSNFNGRQGFLVYDFLISGGSFVPSDNSFQLEAYGQ